MKLLEKQEKTRGGGKPQGGELRKDCGYRLDIKGRTARLQSK